MDRDVQIVVSPEIYMMQIKSLQDEIERKDEQIKILTVQLDYECRLRESLEMRLGEQRAEPEKKTRTKRPDAPERYSDFKSDGKRKPHAADSIRSYDDFRAMQQYYLDRGRIRDWTMWTVGVSLGLRVSDLLSLKFGDIIDTDKKTFMPRLRIREQKTGKSNACLITESVQHAITKYLDYLHYRFDLDGYLFASKKTGGKMYEEYGWKILSDAGKALNLPLVIGSHTMRKSFANIAACVDKSCVDMNSITKVQGLLNHSDQRVTMKYLGSYQDMYDRARIAVSDFVLGKTDVNEIIAGDQYTTEDVMNRLDALEKFLVEYKGEQQK